MVKVFYYENCVLQTETFDEANICTNLSRAMQYAHALRSMGDDYITNVKIVVDV